MYNLGMKELEKKTIRYIERMIELIKFLQYPRTKEDMARFLFKENARNKNKELNVYLKWNHDFNIFNTNVPIHFEELKEAGERKSLWYSGTSSVHPIFLALNASEVFLLTQVLLTIVYEDGSSYFDLYKGIVEKIKKQLSSYMQDKIDWSLLHKSYNCSKTILINESMRSRVAMNHEELDYWDSIEDYSSSVTFQTLERAISLMKFMHLPKTRNEINEFMGCNVFVKEITLNGGLKQRGYWKSKNHNNDYCFLNVVFPFCKTKAYDKDDHYRDIGFVSTAGDVEEENVDYQEEINYTQDNFFDKRNHLRYQQTVHPIFLVLTLDEVYLLTTHLLEIVRKKFKEESMNELKRYKDTTIIQYENIVSKISNQLSRYARNVLTIRINNTEKDFTSEKHYNLEHGITEQNLIMFLKTGEAYSVETVDGLVCGTITWIHDTFYVVDNNGKRHRIIPAKD